MSIGPKLFNTPWQAVVVIVILVAAYEVFTYWMRGRKKGGGSKK